MIKLVLTALVSTERHLTEPRLTGACRSTFGQAAPVYTVLVYTEWIPQNSTSLHEPSTVLNNNIF